MPRIERMEDVERFFRDRAARATRQRNVSVVTGFTASYALYVHENVEMKLKGRPRPNRRGFYWDPQGRAQAKFLEEPARTLRSEFNRIIFTAMRKGKTFAQALILAALRLQREAQLRVPVDTGALKSSAFTRLETR